MNYYFIPYEKYKNKFFIVGVDNESQRYIDNTIAITTSEFNEENGNVIYAGYENSFNLIYDDKGNIKYKYSQEELIHACMDRAYRAVCDGGGTL
ncbi:MAG: hypothetical protein ACTJGD_11610 [Mesonia hippocampi]|uniref:hypothetical protein n=1 Tax=Mesonia hippocampi TaxID=1628250 RepID=UPI003F973FF8